MSSGRSIPRPPGLRQRPNRAQFFSGQPWTEPTTVSEKIGACLSIATASPPSSASSPTFAPFPVRATAGHSHRIRADTLLLGRILTAETFAVRTAGKEVVWRFAVTATPETSSPPPLHCVTRCFCYRGAEASPRSARPSSSPRNKLHLHPGSRRRRAGSRGFPNGSAKCRARGGLRVRCRPASPTIGQGTNREKYWSADLGAVMNRSHPTSRCSKT